jgi:hypothetical protein
MVRLAETRTPPMTLDPRVRRELERRGPANVRELLRTSAGAGPNAPVSFRVTGSSPAEVTLRRSCVEDWLREKEQETEGVMRETLKWAKIAGIAAVIGVIVAVVIGMLGIFATLKTSGH